MTRRTARSLSDSLLRVRATAPKQPRVSIIRNGVKYKPGQPPVRVCPARRPGRLTLATPLQK